MTLAPLWKIKTSALDFINTRLWDKSLEHNQEFYRKAHTPIHLSLREKWRTLHVRIYRKIND